jgi:hypothetical protein
MAVSGTPKGAIRQQHDLHKPQELAVFAEKRRHSRMSPRSRIPASKKIYTKNTAIDSAFVHR